MDTEVGAAHESQAYQTDSDLAHKTFLSVCIGIPELLQTHVFHKEQKYRNKIRKNKVC